MAQCHLLLLVVVAGCLTFQLHAADSCTGRTPRAGRGDAR